MLHPPGLGRPDCASPGVPTLRKVYYHVGETWRMSAAELQGKHHLGSS